MSNTDERTNRTLPAILQEVLGHSLLREAFELQTATQQTFAKLAADIGGQACAVRVPAVGMFGIERNVFSTLFLAVIRAMISDSDRMPLYAMVNQGMRAWVTACDNILDDEYKPIFDFQFPESGPRMRSILTLLLADRVVTNYTAGHYPHAIEQVARLSLRALMPCALQECAEEQRPVPILPPQVILDDIHKRKTADLFAAPLALPLALETVQGETEQAGLAAVRTFGAACQIIDDIRDMPDDVISGRHNLLVSMQKQQGSHDRWLHALRTEHDNAWTAWDRYPQLAATAASRAMQRFDLAFHAMQQIGIDLSPSQRDIVVRCIFALLKVPYTAVISSGARPC